LRKSEADERNEEMVEERTGHLLDLLSSDGWKLVMHPALMEQRRDVLRKLATSRGDLGDMRQLQGAYQVLTKMIESPKDFILGREK
jgi:hypothetical protein